MRQIHDIAEVQEERDGYASFQDIYREDHAAEWAPDPATRTEMAYIESYVEFWGVMRPIRASVEAHGWAYVLLVALVLWRFMTMGLW